MITILMAVYNGEKYLAEQLDSIISQTYQDWQLIICDDCSTDRSPEIAKEFAARYPERIKVRENTTPTGSAKINFMNMLNECDSDYIMFADQDDIWHKDKIKLSAELLTQCEMLHPDKPLLVHTDLKVVDQYLSPISDSFMKYAGFNGKYSSLNRLLVQNNITGCTMMINRKLAELSRNIDSNRVIMHDWWLGLVAATFGEIRFLDTATIDYRQHSSNQVGAKKVNSISQLAKALKKKLTGNALSSQTIRQAEYFIEKYQHILSEQNAKTLNTYISLEKMWKPRRSLCIIKNKFLRQNLMQAIIQVLFG